jgi:hypothetical protein
MDLNKAIDAKHLWLVHAVENLHPSLATGVESYYNYDELIDRTKVTTFYRPLFNHAINTLVLPFSERNIWDCHKYIFVAPMSEYKNEIYLGNSLDITTIAYHKYTNESYLLVPNDEVDETKRKYKPGLQSQIIGYDFPDVLRNRFMQDLPLYGKQCWDALGQLDSSGYGTDTHGKPYVAPRKAVKDLLYKISEENEGAINIWQIQNSIDYTQSGYVPHIFNTSSDFKYRYDEKEGLSQYVHRQFNIDQLLENEGLWVLYPDSTDIQKLKDEYDKYENMYNENGNNYLYSIKNYQNVHDLYTIMKDIPVFKIHILIKKLWDYKKIKQEAHNIYKLDDYHARIIDKLITKFKRYLVFNEFLYAYRDKYAKSQTIENLKKNALLIMNYLYYIDNKRFNINKKFFDLYTAFANYEYTQDPKNKVSEQYIQDAGKSLSAQYDLFIRNLDKLIDKIHSEIKKMESSDNSNPKCLLFKIEDTVLYNDNEYIVTNIDSSCETIDIEQKDKTERLTININDPNLVKYIDVDGGHKKKKLLNKSKRKIKKNKKSCNKK